mgnify:FL=1|tara:strand:- start:19048 stop:19266 length:219 start_codon:yes stop_codon:yes gene_type:complete
MTTLLTVLEIKEKYTKEDIMNIFDKNEVYHSVRNNKKSKNNGMLSVINKENSLMYFNSYTLAYRYFLEMNWI